MTITTHDWLDLLRTVTARFGDTINDAAQHERLHTPVLACPGWTLHDLVAHLGNVHRWAAHAVLAGSPDLAPEAVEHGRPGLAAWYQHHASHLVHVLTETPAEASAWTLDQQDRTAGFWRRRQVHETLMHTWDAEQALGVPRPMDPALAWDGVLEVADILYPRQVRLGRISPLARSLRLVATDGPWEVTLGDGEAEEVRERAEVVLRLLWHRFDPDVEPVPRRSADLLSGALTP